MRALINSYPDVAGGIVPRGVARGIIRRVRVALRPPTPRNFDELDEVLRQYPAIHVCYRGRVVAEDSSVAFISASDFMLQQINNAVELLMDSTFCITPVMQPRVSQMFNIFI